MIVSCLKLANLRTFDDVRFDFQPGFNLIAGANGVGKTSVLDALGVCLSDVVKHANGLRSRIRNFSQNDLRVGATALNVECDVQIDGAEYSYVVHQPREPAADRKKSTGEPWAHDGKAPRRAGFEGDVPSSLTEPRDGWPLALLFSTRRALPSARAMSNMATARGIEAACADALADRNLRLGEFTAWMRVQQALADDRPSASSVAAAFGTAVSRFLPGYSGLRITGEERPELVIDHRDMPLPVAQLSEGERGVLAIVLDLTRRLALANPEMEDPAAMAGAVVLIDEIELHLHPQWQRRIVANLTETFPKCQFIATTRSPQVIGEVEHDRIHMIADGEVYSPSHSFGVDSSRVLEEIMGTCSRTTTVNELLTDISQQISDDRYDDARVLLADLSELLGEDDPEVTRVQTLLDFMADDA